MRFWSRDSLGRGRAEGALPETTHRRPRTADGLSKGMPDSGVEWAGAGPPSPTACTFTARLRFAKGRRTGRRMGLVWRGTGVCGAPEF